MSIEALACVGLIGLVVGFLVGFFGVALARIKNTEIVNSVIDEISWEDTHTQSDIDKMKAKLLGNDWYDLMKEFVEGREK